MRWGVGCSSRILILYPQYWLLKCKRKTFHVREDPRKSEKGQGHHLLDHGNITSYTWG